MKGKIVLSLLGAFVGLAVGWTNMARATRSAEAARVAPQEQQKLTPADGHNIHVLAPHVVAGKVMGP